MCSNISSFKVIPVLSLITDIQVQGSCLSSTSDTGPHLLSFKCNHGLHKGNGRYLRLKLIDSIFL